MGGQDTFLDSVTCIIRIMCLLTVATYWRTCTPAAFAQMPRYLIIHSWPMTHRAINCQQNISAISSTMDTFWYRMLDTTQTTIPTNETQHFPITLVHVATCILVECVTQQTLNSVTNAYLRLQLLVDTPIKKCLCLCCKN